MFREAFYESLIGKSKQDIVGILDMPRSPYESDEWIFIVGKNFFGINRRLYLFFTDDQVYDFFSSTWA